MMLTLAQLALVAGGLWRPVQPGVWQREMPMAPNGALSVVQAIAIRIDPAVVSFRLDTATRDFGMRGAWSIDRMPADALVALNTGQFATGAPWGWLVRDGVEAQPPGRGSVAMAFVVDSAGTPSLVEPNDIPSWRGRVRLAFQSYPALLVGDGELPWELRDGGRGVDLEHRDSRLAIGVLGDGSILFVLTRYTGLGGAAPTLPWGPTVPEMAEFVKSLGARRALLLDGGVSSQMAVRRRDGSVERWENWRSVPVGMVVLPAKHSVIPSGAPQSTHVIPSGAPQARSRGIAVVPIEGVGHSERNEPRALRSVSDVREESPFRFSTASPR